MTADLVQRSVDKVARLSAEPRDLASYWRECSEAVGAVIPHYLMPCWYTLDPASLLATSHFHEGMDEFPAEWLAHEYYGEDVNQMSDVANSATGISTLREATDGNPSTSRRWRFNQTMGSDQEMIARLRAPSGEVWGMLGLYREPGRSMFDADDKRFLRAVSGHLAVGARRALLVGEAIDLDGQQPDAPDLIIVSDRWELQSATPGVERWLDALPDGDSTSGRLPAAVIAVAARARRCAEQSQRHSATVVSRVMSKNGTWIVLHGACLVDAGARRIAVIVEPADPARIHPLLMAAYQLTARERRRSIRLSCPRVRASPGTGGCAGSLSGSSPHRRQRVRERHGSRSRRRRHGGVRRRERGTVPRVSGTARADGRHRGHGVIPDASSPALSFASPRGRIA